MDALRLRDRKLSAEGDTVVSGRAGTRITTLALFPAKDHIQYSMDFGSHCLFIIVWLWLRMDVCFAFLIALFFLIPTGTNSNATGFLPGTDHFLKGAYLLFL